VQKLNTIEFYSVIPDRALDVHVKINVRAIRIQFQTELTCLFDFDMFMQTQACLLFSSALKVQEIIEAKTKLNIKIHANALRTGNSLMLSANTLEPQVLLTSSCS